MPQNVSIKAKNALIEYVPKMCGDQKHERPAEKRRRETLRSSEDSLNPPAQLSISLGPWRVIKPKASNISASTSAGSAASVTRKIRETEQTDWELMFTVSVPAVHQPHFDQD